MATKQKHHSKDSAAALLQQAERWLAKGDFKQALKDAKVSYRQQPGPEARQVLERAYLARGRQLHRAGLHAEARDVIESLLELKPVDTSVEQELPELLIALGLFHRIAAGQSGAGSPQDDSLHAAVADHAVLRPETAPTSLPEIRQGAAAIRRALAELEANRDAEAMAALKDISRASPLADWKYFVRGLAAYYRQDSADMSANWDRLDPGRFATRIAASLRVLADPAVVSIDDVRTTEALTRLGGAVLGGPILTGLQNLQAHVAARRWREVVKAMRALGPLLCQIDAALPQRLSTIVYAAIVRKGNPAAVRGLAAVMTPLPIDPHWNRGLALAWEDADSDDDEDDGEVTQAERYWRKYLDDLEGLEYLLPTELALARALVWLRLGEMLVEQSSAMCPTCGVRHEPDEESQAGAIGCFENALKLSPVLLKAYQSLAEAYRTWGDSRQAAKVWRRLVEHFPEDLETLRLLAEHYLGRDEPLKSREFILRAQRLKPLDADIKGMAASVHLASARHHALAGRFDEGRGEFAAAEKLDSPHVKIHHVLVRRAALELKAGDADLAHRLLDQARRASGEDGPIWLLMTIESRRYGLSKEIVEEFEHRWVTGLKKSRRSAAVGEMCQIVTAHLLAPRDYAGIDDHLSRLLDFLGTCKRIRWHARNLHDAMDFLMALHQREEHREPSFSGRRDTVAITMLLADLAVKGRRKFPDDACFQFMVGEMEMGKGPERCNRPLARKCFQRVVDLTANASDAESLDMARRARNKLDLLNSVGGRRPVAAPRRPLFTDEEDDDDSSEPTVVSIGFDDSEEDDGRPSLLPPDFSGGSPKKMFKVFARLCAEMGLDPEKVLNDAAAGKPFGFPLPPPRKKRK